MKKLPLLVSIPHGGWKVADEIRDVWALSAEDAFHDGDPFTSRIYDFHDRVESQLVMEYYRAVVDLNRAPDDIAPENPDGVIKSHTCWDVPVYKSGKFPGETLRKKLLDRYYFSYHRRIEEELHNPRLRMMIDCHSMAAVSPPTEEDAGTVRPLICLGNLGDANGEVEPTFNRVTCKPELIRFMVDEFATVFGNEDVEVEPPAVVTMNIPFNGGHITRIYGRGRIPVVQIEMSRALYLGREVFDENTLTAKESRIHDLNDKVWRVLKNTTRNL